MNLEPIPSTTYRRAGAQPKAMSAFFWATYGWMAAGLALTGITAWVVANTPAVTQMVLGNRPVFYGLILVELALVVAFSVKVATVSAAAASGMFLAYSFINGLTLSSIFLVYAQASLVQAFFVSAAAYGALATFGALTRRDLSPAGQFLFFGLVGLILASLVNFFFHSPMVDFICTCVGLVVFGGLTAYDNQRLKHLYVATGGAGNLAVHGALMLYLDFINMFLFVLRLFGSRR